MLAGAHILDIGGASTRPNACKLKPTEELERVYKVLCELKLVVPKETLISIDTYSPFVAYTLAKEGLIDIINDVYSGKVEEYIESSNNTDEMDTAQVAAEFGLGYIIMHMQGTPSNMQINPNYNNCSEEVISYLRERAEFSEKRGVKFLAVDPGIGFGKTVAHNLDLISKGFLEKLMNLNKPILVGLSRKSFLGYLYPELTVPSTRDNVTKEFEFSCFANGVKIIRSHVMPSELNGA